ncbi:MAG: DUF3810 domain-containing protein [Romboutsia sp.]
MIIIKKIKFLSLLLLPIALIINFIGSKYPEFIDIYYSSYINKFIIQILSNISGIFPFSLYELTMYLIAFSILIFIIRILILFLKEFTSLKYFSKNLPFLYSKLYSTYDCSFLSIIKTSLLNLLSILSISYFLFIVLWGLNYNRLPLETTLINKYKANLSLNQNLSTNNLLINSDDKLEHNVNDLADLYKFLISMANKTRELVLEDDIGLMKANGNYKDIINRAQLGYDNTSDFLPEIDGNYSKPKYVISSYIMCYTGITGIYFPFTGEANVNVAIPHIYIPSTTLHEMAHQRGFASEDDANFIAYLTSINHPDIDFNYSGYILALNHTANALHKADYDTYISLSKNISKDVKNDLINNSNFWNKYEGKVDEFSNKFNDSYLKANGVTEGNASYGKIIDLLLTYYKLYPQTYN